MAQAGIIFQFDHFAFVDESIFEKFLKNSYLSPRGDVTSFGSQILNRVIRHETVTLSLEAIVS